MADRLPALESAVEVLEGDVRALLRCCASVFRLLLPERQALARAFFDAHGGPWRATADGVARDPAPRWCLADRVHGPLAPRAARRRARALRRRRRHRRADVRVLRACLAGVVGWLELQHIPFLRRLLPRVRPCLDAALEPFVGMAPSPHTK
jgi:hypothetical protein